MQSGAVGGRHGPSPHHTCKQQPHSCDTPVHKPHPTRSLLDTSCSRLLHSRIVLQVPHRAAQPRSGSRITRQLHAHARVFRCALCGTKRYMLKDACIYTGIRVRTRRHMRTAACMCTGLSVGIQEGTQWHKHHSKIKYHCWIGVTSLLDRYDSIAG